MAEPCIDNLPQTRKFHFLSVFAGGIKICELLKCLITIPTHSDLDLDKHRTKILKRDQKHVRSAMHAIKQQVMSRPELAKLDLICRSKTPFSPCRGMYRHPCC